MLIVVRTSLTSKRDNVPRDLDHINLILRHRFERFDSILNRTYFCPMSHGSTVQPSVLDDDLQMDAAGSVRRCVPANVAAERRTSFRFFVSHPIPSHRPRPQPSGTSICKSTLWGYGETGIAGIAGDLVGGLRHPVRLNNRHLEVIFQVCHDFQRQRGRRRADQAQRTTYSDLVMGSRSV